MQVTLSFPGPEGRVEESFQWSRGKKLRDYLRDVRKIGLNLHCRTVIANGEKVRLGYVPKPGERITLTRV